VEHVNVSEAEQHVAIRRRDVNLGPANLFTFDRVLDRQRAGARENLGKEAAAVNSSTNVQHYEHARR
jgi:hypothetical protein